MTFFLLRFIVNFERRKESIYINLTKKGAFMKKFVFIFVIAVVLLSSCGVSKKEHKKLQNDLNIQKSANTVLKEENSKLKKELENIKFGSERLLKNAKNFFSQKKYKETKNNLIDLIKRHPASDDSKEGRLLLVKVESILKYQKRQKELKEKQRIANATRKMKKEWDEVAQMTWYKDRNSGFWGKNVYLYFGSSKSLRVPAPPRLSIFYTADSWLFIKKYIFVIDGKRFEINPNYNDVKRNNGSGSVWETYDVSSTENNVKTIIKGIVKSKKAVLRFEGSDSVYDLTISKSMRIRMKNVLEAYNALGGKF